MARSAQGAGPDRGVRTVKVLHVLGRPEAGGAERWLLDIARADDVHEHSVVFKDTTSGTWGPAFRDAFEQVLFCRLGHDVLGFAWRLARVIERSGCDLVHCHLRAHAGAVSVAARLARRPVVLTVHGSKFARDTNVQRRVRPVRLLAKPYARCSMALAVRLNRVNTAVSPAICEDLDPSGRHRFRPVRLGTEDQRVEPESGDLGGASRGGAILHVGSFTAEKNHHGLLRIFARVLAEEPAATLTLVGDGPLRPQIEAEVRRLGLEERVLFRGVVPNPATEYASASLFLFPSKSEGFPVSVMEAMSAGVPIVAADLPSIRAVTGAEGALLRSVAAEAELADAAVEALRGGEAVRDMVAAARTRWEQELSIDASVRSLHGVYREAVAEAASELQFS